MWKIKDEVIDNRVKIQPRFCGAFRFFRFPSSDRSAGAGSIQGQELNDDQP